MKENPDPIAPAEDATNSGIMASAEFLSREPGTMQGSAKRRKYLLLGMAGLLLLIMGALLVRMSPMLAFPPEESTRKGGTEKPSPVTKMAEPLPMSPMQTAPPAAAIAKSAKQKPTGLAASVYTVSVIHDHVLGSCTGILSVTRDGISFNSEKEKDSFACKPSECSYAIKGDRLVIKSGPRTFRFESATALNEDENSSQISELYRKISDLYKMPASKAVGGR